MCYSHLVWPCHIPTSTIATFWFFGLRTRFSSASGKCCQCNELLALHVLNTVILVCHCYILHTSRKNENILNHNWDTEKSHHSLPLQDEKLICAWRMSLQSSVIFYSQQVPHIVQPVRSICRYLRLQFIGEPWLEGLSREAQILWAHVENATGTHTFLLGCNIKKWCLTSN